MATASPHAIIVRTWRKTKGCTQEGLAALLHVTRGCVAHWEQGRVQVPEQHLSYLKKNWPLQRKTK